MPQTITLTPWANEGFSSTYTNVVPAPGFPRPQLEVSGAPGLVCYDRNAGAATIFATVQQGSLDSGTLVQNGATQIGNPITFDRPWTHVVSGEFGSGGSLVLFYDSASGVAELFTYQNPAGPFKLVKQNNSLPKTWTQLIPGHFTGATGQQLLCYDANAGTGAIYSIDQTGTLHLVKLNAGWRKSWYSILAAKFSGGTYDDLLFYDKAAGTGEFYHSDGHGGLGAVFNTATDWRNTWRGLQTGFFAPGQKFPGLVFYEDTTGYTEFYATDGKGGISRVDIALEGTWSAKAGSWQAVLAGFGFTGTTESGLSSLVGYHPSDGSLSYFFLSVKEVAPVFSVAPSSLTFGPTPVNDSVSQSVTITNASSAALTVTVSPSPSPKTAPFSWNAGTSVIPAAQQGTVEVDFSPHGVGISRENFVITNTATGVAYTITLNGTGVKGPNR